MRLLVFSDWRVQSLDSIRKAIKDEKPDAVLYAGDDINRLFGVGDYVLVKTLNHSLLFKYPGFKPVYEADSKILTPGFKDKIKKLSKCLVRNDFLEKIGVPFYFVNGNDDKLFYHEGNYFHKLYEGYSFDDEYYRIVDTPSGKVGIRKAEFSSGLDGEVSREDGVYTPFQPSFGMHSIRKKRDEISFYGCECTYGIVSEIVNTPKEHADIYLSHLPPLGVLDLSSRFGINHIGSKKLRASVKKHKPRLVVCGHSHMWGGKEKQFGDTLVVNISSHDRYESPGNYALIDTNDWSIEFKKIEERQIPPIRGISTLKNFLRQKMKERGYYTNIIFRGHCVEKIGRTKAGELEMYDVYNSLSDIQRGCVSDFNEIKSILRSVKEYGVDTYKVWQRIKSLSWDKPKILRRITIDPNKHAFVDVETGLAQGLEPGRLWLIGLWLNGVFKQFTVPEETKDFLIFLKENNVKYMVSWTNYDAKALAPLLEEAKRKIKFIDACQRTSNCVIWYTYQLHELYHALFPEEDYESTVKGFEAGIYADHLIIPKKICGYCPSREGIRVEIVERNRVDVLQMFEIVTLLRNVNVPTKKTNRN